MRSESTTTTVGENVAEDAGLPIARWVRLDRAARLASRFNDQPEMCMTDFAEPQYGRTGLQ